MARTEALKRRVAKLQDHETEALREFSESLSFPELLAAMRAAGYPIPAGDDPWELPRAERLAYAVALQSVIDRKPSPLLDAEADRAFRAHLWHIKARHRMA